MELVLKNVLHIPGMTVNVVCWPVLASTGHFVLPYHVQDDWNIPGSEPWHRPGQHVLGHWGTLNPVGFVDDPIYLKLRLNGQAPDETHLDPQQQYHWDTLWPWEEGRRWNRYRGNHRRQTEHQIRVQFDMVLRRITDLLQSVGAPRQLLDHSHQRHTEWAPGDNPDEMLYDVQHWLVRNLPADLEQQEVLTVGDAFPEPTLEDSLHQRVRRLLGPTLAHEVDRWPSRHPVNVAHDLIDWTGK